MTDQNRQPVLSIKGLKKSFGDKTVVQNLSFDLYSGEILALVGENGAGKSTTKNMLCGLLTPSAGEIEVDGKAVESSIGRECGISAVHQELSLFKDLTVSENLCIYDIPGKAFNVDWSQACSNALKQLAFLGIEIDVNANIESLGAGKQQIIEIAKALSHADKVLVLDEPTTSLTAPEREKLFSIMHKLKEQGLAIIFISHFMDEIYKMADKYVVLRDGHQVGTGKLVDVPREELEHMMVGREIGESDFTLPKPINQEKLRVENLSSYDFDQINFSVNQGEILGVAGLMGAGRTEVMEAVFGLRQCEGRVFVGGELVSPLNVTNMLSRQVCYITEDRRSKGNFSGRSIVENTTAAKITRFVKRLVWGVGFKGEEKSANDVVTDMNVALPSIQSKIEALSGGNQQKVLLGRWLATKPEVIIFDEPTKGVDIGAKFDIHNKIIDLAKSGVAVVIVSSDLQELLDCCHRILVMRTGHKVGEFSRDEFDPAKIISLAASSAHEQVGKAENIKADKKAVNKKEAEDAA